VAGARPDPEQGYLVGRRLSAGLGAFLVGEQSTSPRRQHVQALPGAHPPVPLLLPHAAEARARSAAWEPGSAVLEKVSLVI